MAQKFASAIQVFKTATAIAQIINQLAILQFDLGQLIATNVAEYANWHLLAHNLLLEHPLLVGCCNALRRKRLADLADVWTRSVADTIEKMTIDMLRLIELTSEVIQKADEAMKAAVTNPIGVYRQKFIVIELLLLTLETTRHLSTLSNTLSQQYPGNLDFRTLQPLLFNEPVKPFEFMHDAISEGLLCLHSMDDSWEHHGSKFRTWASGQFDEPLTLDFLLPRNISPVMAQGLQVSLGQILFFIAAAMYDVRQTGTLSEKQLEKLQKGVTAVDHCLDMHHVFIPGIEQWINTNLKEMRTGVRTLPAQSILDAIERFYIWERPLEMLYAREGRKYELAQLAKEKTKDVAQRVEQELEHAEQRPQHMQQDVTQPSVPSELEVQLLEHLRVNDDVRLEDSWYDNKMLEDFQDFYNNLIKVDAGRSSSFPVLTASTPGSSVTARQYGKPNAEDTVLFGEECAVLLAEAPFQRVLDYHDITDGANVRKEITERISALQETYRQLKRVDSEAAELERNRCMDIMLNDFAETRKPFVECRDD